MTDVVTIHYISKYLTTIKIYLVIDRNFIFANNSIVILYMRDVPDYILNPRLYKKAKLIADDVYERHSAYKSMFIQKKYKELGGKYSTSKDTKKVKDWKNERWIQIEPYVRDRKVIPCGKENNPKACRPLKKINEKISIHDIMNKYTQKQILKLIKQKQVNMDGKLNWRKGTFKSSM